MKILSKIAGTLISLAILAILFYVTAAVFGVWLGIVLTVAI